MKENPNDRIQDLSFSNLVNIVQKDEEKAKYCLIKFADEMEFVKYKIQDLEKQLTYLKGRKESLIESAHQVCNMIEKPIPLAVISDGCIVVVSEISISIESNVL